MSVLAHAGGWDELLLAAAVVVMVLMLRPRRKDGAEVRDGPCLYCGRHLPAGTQRCPDCGFRARRGFIESPTGAER